ncbi:MAG: hypothetical protein V3V98_07200 [Thermoplasmata archaeon]
MEEIAKEEGVYSSEIIARAMRALEEVGVLERELSALQAELDEKDAELSALQRELEGRDLEISSAQNELVDKDSELEMENVHLIEQVVGLEESAS